MTFRNCVMGGCGLLVLAAATAHAQSGPDPDLANLIGQYENVSTIEVVAAVDAFIVDEACCTPEVLPGELIEGEYRYRVDGESYRILSKLDPSKVSGQNLEVAYDGENFQLLRKNTRRVLSFGAGDRDLAAPLLPDPVLAVLSFIYPRDDTNFDRPLKLKEVVSDDDANARISNVQWTAVTVDGRTFDRAEFSGGVLDGKEFDYHVYTAPNRRWAPLKIECVASTGVILSIEFSHYREADAGAPGTLWPRNVVFSAFNDQGDRAAQISFVITSLAVGESMEPGIFSIDFAEADRVWSDDLEMFIQ